MRPNDSDMDSGDSTDNGEDMAPVGGATVTSPRLAAKRAAKAKEKRKAAKEAARAEAARNQRMAEDTAGRYARAAKRAIGAEGK